MSSASPFPTQQSTFGMAAQPIPVARSGNYIPGWYVANPHQNPEAIVVKDQGVPLVPGFTVADVAPERRWAILLDGNLMPQAEFHGKMQEYVLGWYEYLKTQGRQAHFGGDITKIYIPNVKDFVSMKIDPTDDTKLMDIHYDPRATDGARVKQFVDRDGEPVEGERLELLCEAYADPKLRKKLKAYEIKEIEAHLGIQAGAGPVDIAMKLEILNEMLTDGEINQDEHSRRVAALTGAKVPEKKDQPPDRSRRGKHTAPCGETVPNFKKRKHLLECSRPECVAAREDTS